MAAVLVAPRLLADTLALGSSDAPAGGTVSVPLDLTKENPVVGVQFRLRYPGSHVESGKPFIGVGETDHRVQTLDDQEGDRLIVVYSPTNEEFPADFSLSLPLNLLSNSPLGGPSLSVEDIIFTDAVGNTFGSAVNYTFIEDWRRVHFSGSEREDPSVIGDDQDPDGDGQPNLLELGSGEDPRVPGDRQDNAPIIEVAPDGKTYLKILFRRATDPTAQLVVPVGGEASRDLEEWSTAEVTETSTGNGDAASDEFEAKVEIDPAEARMRFLRVAARRVEE